MTDADIKGTVELAKLSQEIALLREQVLAVGNALNRIEKRLTLVFPTYERKLKRPPRMRGNVAASSTKTREELLGMFEDLLASTRAGGDSAFAADHAERGSYCVGLRARSNR